MRRSLLCSLLYLLCSVLCVIVLLSFSTAFASAQTPQTVTASMRPYKGARAIVAVTLNGAGPYDFLVDTGATITLLDAGLFQQLGLEPQGSRQIHSLAGTTLQVVSSVEEVAVEGLSARNIRVLRIEKLPLANEYRGVRGVLGENFLQHFDVLIDNQRRKITLDAGSSLAQSLGGEHLPITFPPVPRGEEPSYRPLVSITVPDFDSRHLTVLLDSGADGFSLVGTKKLPRTMGLLQRVSTVSGSMTCNSSQDALRWGKTTLSDLTTVTCQSSTAIERDYEGTLPTFIFQRIFISHAGSYVIVEPSKHAPAPQEVAALTPSAR